MGSDYSDNSASLFSVGSVLNLTFSCLGKMPGLFLGLAAIAALPNLVLTNLAESSRYGDIVSPLLSGFFTSLFEGAVAFGVYQILRERSVTFGEALAKGLARLFPLVVAAFIIHIGITVGFLLLVVPGLVLTCMWSVSIPACVVENLGPIDSMRRSAELTKGYRWQILGLFLMYVVAGVFIILGASFLFLLPAGDRFSSTLGARVIGILPSAVYAIMLAVVYYQLRSVKEGVAIDKLTNVFD